MRPTIQAHPTTHRAAHRTTHLGAGSLAALSLTALLAACGGGGGGGGDNGPGPQPGQGPVALSASNYQAAAQASISGTVFMGNASELASGLTPPTPKTVNVAAEQVRRIAALGPKPLAMSTLDLPCEGGSGKISITTNDANSNSKFDAGDSLTLQADACKSGATLLQGRIVLTLRELSGGDYGSSNFNARLDMALSGFTVTEGSNRSTGDGSLAVAVNASPLGITSSTLEVPTLTLSGRFAGNSYNHTLSTAVFTERIEEIPNGGGTRTTTTVGATLASNLLGGQTVRIDTDPGFVTLGGNTFPGSGQMFIKGSGGSKVRVTALNVAQVQIELDANGDGTYETSVTKNWTALVSGN